jgi:hypothetical protein
MTDWVCWEHSTAGSGGSGCYLCNPRVAMTWTPARKSTPFKSGVMDIKGIQKRLYEMGSRTFTGEKFPAPKPCSVRAGGTASTCWCCNGDGTYQPCPSPDE